MIIAVTGASGRIGRATLAELKASGIAEVWALDRSLPPSGLADRSLYCDLSNPGDVYGAIAGADAVIHLGAHASTAHHPGEQVYANNGSATANVVAACIALRIPRVAYASSITVYGLDWQARHGGITHLPADETVGTRPDDLYALSKLAGEQVVSLGANEHGLHGASLRIAMVVGEDEYATRGRPRDDRDASGGLWSYVDARDVAQAARLAVMHLDGLGVGNHIFNVGAADSHTQTPVGEVIERWVPELAPLAHGFDGAPYSIAKARSILGYAPRYSWRDHA